MVDWGLGRYETAAAELEPVARAVVEQAAVVPGEAVIDVACGTGNAALLAAARGGRVVGVDTASRLLDVARERALEQAVELDLRRGELLALPVDDASADAVLSVFGVIFATDPALALGEFARILRPGGRALFSAWVPAGPIDAMLAAMGQIVGRITQAPPPPQRFAWSDPAAVGAVADRVGLTLQSTTTAELAIRHESPEAYVADGEQHPVAVATRSIIHQAGADAEVRAAMTEVLRKANEDPHGFLIHTPYVVHVLRPSSG
jgi:SAM-dependent methyltransferase